MSFPIITFSFNPRRRSSFPSKEALIKTREVSWKEAEERKLSVLSAILEIPRRSCVISASFSDIKGGFEGEGNIDANPLFINSEEGNFLLQTIELGYNNNSPCKGTGENGTDMGAFSNVIP